MESTPSSASEAKEQAQEKAQQAAGQAKGQLRSQVDQRSTQAGEQVRTQADDLRTVAQQLREQGKDQPAKVAEQAADRAERLGGYLTSADADTILQDIEDFGRRQPLAVALGGLALGFAASRLLKASSQQRYGSGGAPSASRQPIAQIPQHTSAPTAHPATPPVSPTPAPADPAGAGSVTDPVGGRLARPGVPTGGGVA